jgi:hypothetical protein
MNINNKLKEKFTYGDNKIIPVKFVNCDLVCSPPSKETEFFLCTLKKINLRNI